VRLTLDWAITNNKYSKRALKHKVVLNTWKCLLKNEESLPRNWLESTGVLVGINQITQGGMPDIPEESP